MTQNILAFVKDFKKSQVYSQILHDSKIDVIMIWVTGSTLTSICDTESDYDLCVLCTQKPITNTSQIQPFRLYDRPGSYFLKYKPENKKVQWIYNDLSEILKVSQATPLDNIGWAQFKNITSEAIIYQNPKYSFFIEYLVSIKDQIFKMSAYLFVEALLKQLESDSLLELFNSKPTKPNKGLYHIGWLADSLQDLPIISEKLLRIKRTPVIHLSQEDITYLVSSINYLMEYKKTFNPTKLSQYNLIEMFQKLSI